MSSSISKIATERNQRTLMELAMQPGNDVCADCKARAPRWASYNIGIFICVHCASIHRKIGTHITKVKSLTLDAWSKEQVEVMKDNGNVKSNELYNPNETRHPPPANMIDSERDSELEKFIRSKYEFRRFMDRKPASQPFVPPPRTTSAAVSPRPRSMPVTASTIARKTSPIPPPLPAKTPQNMPSKLNTSGSMPSSPLHNTPLPMRSAQPLPSYVNLKQPAAAPAPASAQPSMPRHQVWDDLISLQDSSHSPSLPLQYQPPSLSIPMSSPHQPQQPRFHPALNVPPNPFANITLSQHSPTQIITPLTLSPTIQPPFGPSTPLASPSIHLGSSNPFSHPQFTGMSPGAHVTACPANPFPSPLGMQHTQAAQPAQVQGSLTPTLALSPGAPPPFSAAGPSQAPFPIGAEAHSPFSAIAQTPFSLSALPMQQSQQLFSAASPHPAFDATPFLSQQQPQQQQHMSTTPFCGWPGQGGQGGY
ncbi:putative GTPase activating protein for Arf-domain-containing protein [Melanogaster broomeanus]|nr:putative GTPase activating protein for Arf-domain-containing protein [Melanogaster broomeanus]